MRVPAPERSYFLLGSELHRIAARQLTLKRDGQPLLTETEVAELIEKNLGTVVKAVGTDGKPLVKFAKDETAEILVEDAIAMALVYMKEVLPQIQPLAIELMIGPEDGLFLPESGRPVKAVLDLIDSDACIRDLKSGRTKWPEGAAEKRLQTSVYAWAYRVRYGMPPPAFKYDLVLRKKRGKKRTQAEAEYVPIKIVPDPLLEFGALRRMESILDQMRDGRYYPITGVQCGDCSFEEFCGRHFASLPFAPCPSTAPSAPAEGPRYLTSGG
jgi:hypothetical protein